MRLFPTSASSQSQHNRSLHSVHVSLVKPLYSCSILPLCRMNHTNQHLLHASHISPFTTLLCILPANHTSHSAIQFTQYPPHASYTSQSAILFTQHPPHVSRATWSVFLFVGFTNPRNWSSDTALIKRALSQVKDKFKTFRDKHQNHRPPANSTDHINFRHVNE